jgi:hypothetical protein
MNRLFPLRRRLTVTSTYRGADDERADIITLTDIGGYVARFECPGCGRRTCGVAARQGLVYDERRLVVVHVKCDACRATQDFYFTVAAETASG